MADRTAIEWTDATWNPVTGCSVVSPGCTNCYAMRLAGTRLKHHRSRVGLTTPSKAGPVWNGRVHFKPLSWRRPRRIFVCAHGDLFHEAVPDDWIDRVFAVMALAPQHSFQVLTKRAERMRAYLIDDDLGARIATALGNMLDGTWIWAAGARHRAEIERLIGAFSGVEHDDDGNESWPPDPMPLPNVWLGVSAEDQARADERILLLLGTPAAVRFVSAEPLLGPLDLENLSLPASWPRCDCPDSTPTFDAFSGTVYCAGCCEGPEATAGATLDWVIAGGESGSGSRPMHPDWARSLRDQCAAAEVPFFFNQWGAFLPAGQKMGDGRLWAPRCGSALRATKAVTGRQLDGVQHDAMPELAIP